MTSAAAMRAALATMFWAMLLITGLVAGSLIAASARYLSGLPG